MKVVVAAVKRGDAFYIDVNIRRFLLVHEFIFTVLFVNLYKKFVST